MVLCLAPAAFPEEPHRTEPIIEVEGFDVDPPPSDDFRGALSCWRRLVRVDLPPGKGGDNARSAIDRLLSTARGRGVVVDLCDRLDVGAGKTGGSLIEIHFVDDLLPECNDSSDGCFLPTAASADRYQLFIRNQLTDAATEPTEFVFGEYPGNPDCAVVTFYEKAASSMAHTAYHELLHVWFVNAHAGERRLYPTGHGDVGRCEFEEEFLDALSAHAYELAVIEGNQPPPFLRVRDTKHTP